VPKTSEILPAVLRLTEPRLLGLFSRDEPKEIFLPGGTGQHGIGKANPIGRDRFAGFVVGQYSFETCSDAAYGAVRWPAFFWQLD
jgi:hypothetical protein